MASLVIITGEVGVQTVMASLVIITGEVGVQTVMASLVIITGEVGVQTAMPSLDIAMELNVKQAVMVRLGVIKVTNRYQVYC